MTSIGWKESVGGVGEIMEEALTKSIISECVQSEDPLTGLWQLWMPFIDRYQIISTKLQTNIGIVHLKWLPMAVLIIIINQCATLFGVFLCYFPFSTESVGKGAIKLYLAYLNFIDAMKKLRNQEAPFILGRYLFIKFDQLLAVRTIFKKQNVTLILNSLDENCGF